MTEITLVVKQGCETCTLIEPIMGQIAEHFKLQVICQDTQDFPRDLPVEFDASLEQSYRLRIEVVPTSLFEKMVSRHPESLAGTSPHGKRFSAFNSKVTCLNLDLGVVRKPMIQACRSDLLLNLRGTCSLRGD